MSKKALILLLCSIPFWGMTQSKWNTIDRLVGTWKITKKQQFEVWQKAGDYDIKGEGIKVNALGEKKVLELLQIEGHPKGGIYYKATVPDQNEGKTVSFYLSKWDKKNLVFENPKHDFPQKIHYTFKGKKKLHVHVSGGGNGFVVKMIKVKD